MTDPVAAGTGPEPSPDPAAGGVPPGSLVTPVAAASVLLALHAWLYAHWLVDDAGISFAYARNLAAGHGLVAQPGAPAVEGYSNPLWVLIAALGYRLGVWVLPIAPKLVSLALLVASLGLVAALARRLAPGDPVPVAGGALFLCAVQPSLVIWGTSGLENPLLLVLVLATAEASLRAAVAGGGTRFAGAGLLAAAAAMTRPDAVLWLALPVLALLDPGRSGRPGRGRERAGLLLGFGIPFGLFLCHRVMTFGELVPNTYWAKAAIAVRPDQPGTSLLDRLWLVSALGFGPLTWHLPLLAAAGLAVRLGRSGALTPALRLVGSGLLVGLAILLLLPPDWMGELRFATALFPFLYLWILGGVDRSLAAWPREGRRLAMGLLLVAIALPGYLGWRFRALRFRDSPTIDLGFVTRAYAERFDRYAAAFGLEPGQGSVLAPDLGGLLLSSRLRVHDLAGLCDRTIARTLDRDPEALARYVFEELRPDFLHMNPKWAVKSRLGAWPRFLEEYVALHEYPQWEGFDSSGLHPGFWVRRELAAGQDGVLAAIRAEDFDFRAAWRDAPPNPLADLLRAAGPGMPAPPAPFRVKPPSP